MGKVRTGVLVAGGVLAGFLVGQSVPAAAQFGGVVRGGAIILLVDKFGGDIDRFINSVTGNRTTAPGESTRVVPIISVGQSTAAGAVQISGPKEQVDKVKAVAQIEGKKKIGTDVRVRAMIPVGSRDVKDINSISRIKGVGVSALLDIKL
jgi:hypothetical protein